MLKCLLFVFLGGAPLLGASLGEQVNFPLAEQENQEVVIHNRVLVKVNGESISLMDVVKKMDLLFYRQYPQYATSPQLRYQYYQVNWEQMLNSVIDDHLIVADAKEKKVEVTDGDIRETMEQFFGPEVVVNLDKMGMTYDEARKLIETELIVRRMVGMMVRSRAQCAVRPAHVKELYEKIAATTPLDEKWVYKMLTIQSQDEEKSKSLAAKALELLSEQKVAFDALPSLLKEPGEEGTSIRLSEEYRQSEKELSAQHKAVLLSLGVGACSQPVVQTSKRDGSHVVRLFQLKEKEKPKEVLLGDMEEKLELELLEKAIERYNVAYTEKLRDHYGVTKTYLETMIPDDFQPFALR